MIKTIALFSFMFSSSFCKQTRSVEIPDVTIKEDIKIGLFYIEILKQNIFIPNRLTTFDKVLFIK